MKVMKQYLPAIEARRSVLYASKMYSALCSLRAKFSADHNARLAADEVAAVFEDKSFKSATTRDHCNEYMNSGGLAEDGRSKWKRGHFLESPPAVLGAMPSVDSSPIVTSKRSWGTQIQTQAHKQEFCQNTRRLLGRCRARCIPVSRAHH